MPWTGCRVSAELLSIFTRLQNPVTPWAVLALTTVAWLALYWFASGTGRS